jgi:molybdopterin-guanine dinucleotide biosynthesis protein A
MMASNNISPQDVTALILAGGEGRRMGGQDKGLINWQERPFIEYALDAIPAGISRKLISCNRNIDQYQKYGETVQDNDARYEGPLAGIYAAMQVVCTPFILVLPCDSPLLPKDLYQHLASTLKASYADICYVDDGIQKQYLFALIRTSLEPSLKDYLASGNRQVHRWYKQHQFIEANLSEQQSAFRNVNRREDLVDLN